MSNSGQSGNPLQILFLVLGFAFLVLALAAAVRLMDSAEGRKSVLYAAAGASAFFFLLVTIIHLKH